MGDIFGGGAFVLIGTFFMIFLTNNVGLSPILAGLLFGFGRFWMAITDPFLVIYQIEQIHVLAEGEFSF
ncbi:hypothetical protein [Francisella sp. TX07-6608]|uniref:hypothetical protein n=1 Tax=Francisella sp. TX07-6608 TaxID=573568 RepID=UPI001F1ACC95|nr:hypothetical protein [Francisella sp. TX07-6608]